MSGETKFTPGPWVTEIHNEDGKQIVRTDEDEPWYLFEAVSNSVDIEANAHLIAASPELYAALEVMCHGTDDMLEWAALVQRGREALRKARGESQ